MVRDLRESGEKIDGAVFGHIETHKNLVDRICGELGLELIMPLWKRNSEQIVNDLIASGFEAIMVVAKADLLGEEWLGRKVDMDFLSDLKLKFDTQLCGEAGEYHTFVIDGPLFNQRLEILEANKVLREGYWFLEILKWNLRAK